MDIRKLKNVMEKIPEHYINKMQEKYLTLRPYDLEKYLSKKPAKKGLLYETDRYRNFIKFLKENNVNNKFYLKLNEGIDLVVVSDNLDLIQEIVMHLYSCKKKNNLEALSNFIFENKADIENDIQADLNIVEAPGVKHINSYIDKVIHFTLTKDSVTEDMINFLFNGKCEIPIDSRKHIVKNIYSTIDKSIMDELDRNLKNFKQAMQYTLIAKVITGLKDTESYDIPNEKSINITEGLEGDTVTKTTKINKHDAKLSNGDKYASSPDKITNDLKNLSFNAEENEKLAFKNKNLKDQKEFLLLLLIDPLPKNKISKRDICHINYKNLDDAFTHKDVEIEILSSHMTNDALEYLKTVLDKKIKKEKYSCGLCIKKLRLDCVACDSCLSWFHFQCANYDPKSDPALWFCKTCLKDF